MFSFWPEPPQGQREKYLFMFHYYSCTEFTEGNTEGRITDKLCWKHMEMKQVKEEVSER